MKVKKDCKIRGKENKNGGKVVAPKKRLFENSVKDKKKDERPKPVTGTMQARGMNKEKSVEF